MGPVSTSTILALTCLFLGAQCRTTLSEYEIEAQQIIDESDFAMQAVYTHVKQFLFMNNDERHLSDLYELSVYLAYLQNITLNLSKRLSALPYENFQDEETKRRVRTGRDIGLLVLNADQLIEYSINLNTMTDLSTHRGVCDRNDITKCNLAFLPHIRSVFANSEDPAELEYYWLEWRRFIREQGRQIAEIFLRLYREISIKNGFSQPSAQWYFEFEDQTMLSELEAVMDQLRPLYVEFHAYVRHALAQRYGPQIIPETEPIPQHLFDQTLLQAWKKNSVLQQPYPERRLPNVKEKLDAEHYTSLNIVQASDLFYQSMGLPLLPEDFWSQNIKELPQNEAGPDCKAESVVFRTAITLKYCPRPTFRKWLQMHGVMAKVRYGYARSTLPLGVDGEACPGFSQALGESVILAASTPRHLQKIGLVPEYDYDNEIGLNRLFRMGVHTIFSVPIHFVHEKLTAQLLDGHIQLDDLNCAYWNLMERYVGVRPPVARTKNDLDMSYRFYAGLDENAHTTEKLISEILGYQFYKAFCERSGQYYPGRPSFPLDNCDFSNNLDVGREMMRMMALGSKKNWRDIIEPVVGDRRLNAQAMIDYYEPLKQWLQEQNRQNRVRLGWTSSNSCA